MNLFEDLKKKDENRTNDNIYSYKWYVYLKLMSEKNSNFDDFLIATILADIFDPSGSDDLDFVSEKIVNGLINNGIMKNDKFVEEENIAA